MDIKVKQGSLTEAVCDVLIVNLFENVKIPSGGTGAADKALDSLISSYVIEKENFKAKIGEIYVLPTYGKLPADKVLIVGLGKQEEFNHNSIRHISSTAIKKAISLKAKKVCTILHGAGIAAIDPFDSAQMIIEGSIIGAYNFIKYKSKQDDDNVELEELTIVELDSSKTDKINKGVQKGKIIADAVNFTKDMVNEPASVATPTKLAEIAKSLKGIECRIIEKQEAENLGMGAFLGVAQGSSEPPKFIHMTYKPENASTKKVAIIGKGITFDSGGLDIKPASSMVNMKEDMSGAAAVIAVMNALSELKPDVEVHGLVATCENMPDGKSYRPGDILKAMNGKTIEIDNTDAEGRLTLADAISYAVSKLQVNEIIYIATLTGACMIALGRMASGIMGNNQELIDKLIESANSGGERLWQLPMYKEYKETLKSHIADFKNAGSREAGASVAGVFLSEFAGDTPWAHIDIAGPSWLDNNTKELSKGPSGVGVRTLINYLLR